MIPLTEVIHVVSATGQFPSSKIRVTGVRAEDAKRRPVEFVVDFIQCPTIVSDLREGAVDLEIPRGRWAYSLDMFRSLRGGEIGAPTKPSD